ncbi:hypothetical protein YC2023_002448 [Brassica napus]|uniref:(rape) hypothetical protein n=1 Tax=Brassica napus TaxID=3708 RepID=A0A816XV79_BRANA|nr:unnamed protein product [Brassica napus]
MTLVTLSFVEDFGFGLLGNILAQLCFGGSVVLLYVCGRSFSGLLWSIFEGRCSSLASPRLASPLGGGPMPLKVSFGDYPYTTASSFAL